MARRSIPIIPLMIDSDGNRIKTKHFHHGFFTDSKGNLKFINFVVHHPCLILLFVLTFCFGITIALALTVFENGNPITDDSNTFDLFDKRSIDYNSLLLAKEEVIRKYSVNKINSEKKQDNGKQNEEKQYQEDLLDVTYWIYEGKTEGGVFTKESLQVMREAENMLTGDKRYPKYCRIVNTTCSRPLSVLSVFYASSWNSIISQTIIKDLTPENISLYNSISACIEYNIYCQLVPTNVTEGHISWAKNLNKNMNLLIAQWDGEGELNQNPEEVTLLLAKVNQIVTKSPKINFFFDKHFSVDNPISMYSRSIIFWGGPLAAADETSSLSIKGSKTASDSKQLLKKFLVKNFLNKFKDISAENHNPHVNSYYFMGVLIFDVIIDILLWDSLKAILSFSLVFAYLRLMVGSWFLAGIGILEIILSLPLAWFFCSEILQIKYFSMLNTLCVFIVAAIGADDIFVFMDAYRQSAHKGNEVLQSLESRMSWVYRRSGKAMAITSTTTCLAFLCTVQSPIASTRSFGIFAALVIFFDYILVMTLFTTAVIIYHNRFEQPGCCCFSGCCLIIEPSPTQIAMEKSSQDDYEFREDRISYFFRTKVADFIQSTRNRALLTLPILVWIGIATYYTTQLEPTRTTEQELKEDHPLQKGITIINEKFPKSQEDGGTNIFFTWGLQEVNLDKVNQLFDPDFIGSPTFVENFKFNMECQKKMVDTCYRLKTEEKFEKFIKRGKDGLRSVKCFVDELGAYNAFGNLTVCDEVKKGTWKNEEWYLSSDKMESRLTNFASERSCYGNDKVLDFYKTEFGFDGKTLLYAGLSVESPIFDSYNTLPEDIVREQYDSYISFAQEFDADMENECQGKVIMTDLDQKFIFMNNQKIYQKSAISGSMIGVAISFIVLVVSTRNFLIAFFATMSILCVLLSVIGSITMMGWSLGTNEAILMSILAGFSVDYVVHLAHAYVEATGTPCERLKESFGDMGISVFSGMLTSVIASVPLLFCTISFLRKFGIFLCLTITFSWGFANLGFMSALAQFRINIKKKKK